MDIPTKIPVALMDHLEKILSFSIIAKTGSFRRASIILRRTQPSLSRTVKILEDAIDQPLLLRSRSGVLPTEAGKVLIQFSAKISAEVSRVEHSLRSSGKGLSAKVLVGSYSSLAIRIWPSLMREISISHPGISITLNTDCQNERMLSMVRSSQLDLAFSISPRPYSDIVSYPIFEDFFEIYGSSKYVTGSPHARKRVSVPKWDKIPFILVPSSIYEDGKTIENLAWQSGLLREQLVHEVDSFEAAKEFITEGVGIGLLPNWVAKPAIDSGKIVPIQVDGIQKKKLGVHTVLATLRKTDIGNEAILAVMEKAKSIARMLR